MNNSEIQKLKQEANTLRKDLIRYSSTEFSSHFGGPLSVIETLTYLYFHVLKNKDLNSDERDKVILSKGHSCVPLYIVFSRLGYIKPDELNTYKCLNSRLQAHPDMKRMKMLDFSSGSLGQGLSVGTGMAIANRIKGDDYNIHVILGDGECEEGQVWEAALSAAKYKLGNLICFVDNNKFQSDESVEPLMPAGTISKKWEAFGWHTVEVDGHDFEEIDKAYQSCLKVKDKPNMIICHTIKGKGVSFIENRVEWHSKKITEEQKINALKELEGNL
ncbi:MAG TPA: transketolase [Ruminiclostridium sp.]|nr:transketolase [Ruminiclostridium sp.]